MFNRLTQRISIIFAVVIALASSAVAEEIFKWTDQSGIVHYSTKKQDPRASMAELPPINRGEIKLTKHQMVTCKAHGGINCKSGPDKDGSVICYDGFTGASSRYRFSCNTPKLGISDISDPSEDGSFAVFVRNSKSVMAKNPTRY